MRRPTSDVRQRETRRLIGEDSSNNRRRNSSVPFSNVRLDKARYSQDSDTDYLCDRAVEFMDSGDICSIVAVELAEQSLYFERLLRYHRGRGCIRLPEFLNAGFSAVIEFIRRGYTSISKDNVYEIFIAADYLLVPKLKEQCSFFIQDISNDPSVAINLWVTGRPLHWPEIGNMAFQKILENFERSWFLPEFAQLDFKDVETIIMHDSLNCKGEETVFMAIMRWLAVSPGSRSLEAQQLLWNVRLGMLTMSEIAKMRENENLNHVADYQKILNDWPNSIYDLVLLIDEKQRKKLTKPRYPHEVLCVFGGWCDGEGPRAAAQIFNPRANTWTLWSDIGCQTQSPIYEWLGQLNLTEPTPLQNTMDTSVTPIPEASPTADLHEIATLPEGLYNSPQKMVNSCDTNCLIGDIPRRVYAGCVLVGNRVYLVGGFDGTNALKSTLCYDFEVDSGWYEISCMYEKRYYVSVAYADKYIYALGGHNGENQGRLDTAERYNLEENLWQPIASMNRIRSDAAAAELNNRVYVAGGFEGRRYHDSAEYYDADSNQWTLISRMHSPRGGISLAQHGGYLYAIGGNDGSSRLRSIERFDPVQGKWEVVGQMNRRKSNLSSAVLDGFIYIIGGWSDEPEAGILGLVERFDTETKECTTIRTLNFPASATCACTLQNRHLVKRYIRPINSSSNSSPMATEVNGLTPDLRSPRKTNFSDTPEENELLTDIQLGNSTNNFEQTPLQPSTTTFPYNNSANYFYVENMPDVHRNLQMDCLHETDFVSDLEDDVSVFSESGSVSTDSGTEETAHVQNDNNNQSMNQNPIGDSSGRVTSLTNTLALSPPNLDVPTNIVTNNFCRNLRSTRRNIP